MSNSDEQIHVAMLPGAGMGHLVPFLRVAQTLLRQNTKLTLIISQPIVSSAESNLISRFLSCFPQVNELPFHITPLDPSLYNPDDNDPFFLQFEAVRQSAPLLNSPLSALQPPLSVLVSDVSSISATLPLTNALQIPNYVLFNSCASMFSVFAHYPFVKMSQPPPLSISIPGNDTIPTSSLPPALLVPNSIFSRIFTEDGRRITEIDGVLLNAMDAMEGDTLAALNSGMVVQGLPPVIPLGPLLPCEFENPAPECSSGNTNTISSWLDGQPPGSVVFASFGSRTAVGREQIREIGIGLVGSGYRFLWVVKDSKVDKEDKSGLEEVVGEELMGKIKERGMVVKDWVNQVEILQHVAVGGFVSHCGWNSSMEAALTGVPVLAWPQLGDQMVNAQLIAKVGYGIWVKEWGWGLECVVKGEEIGRRIKELMENQVVKAKALEMKEEGIKALHVGGSCDTAIQALIHNWSKAA